MNYSTIIETFVTPKVVAKAKFEDMSELEDRSEQSREMETSNPSSTSLSSQEFLANKVRFKSDKRAAFITRVQQKEKEDDMNKAHGKSNDPRLFSTFGARRQRPLSSSVPSPLQPSSLVIDEKSPKDVRRRGYVRREEIHELELQKQMEREMAFLEERVSNIKIKQAKAVRRLTRSDLLGVVQLSEKSHRLSTIALQDVVIEDMFEKRKSLRIGGGGGGAPGRGNCRDDGYGRGRPLHQQQQQRRRGSEDSFENCRNTRRYSKMR